MTNFYQDTETIAQIKAADVTVNSFIFFFFSSVPYPWTKEAPASDVHAPASSPAVLDAGSAPPEQIVKKPDGGR